MFPTIALSQHGEVCSVDASVAEQFFFANLDIISMSPLYSAVFFSCPQTPLGDFLGALDNEEFFVVEGSGVAGSPGV